MYEKFDICDFDDRAIHNVKAIAAAEENGGIAEPNRHPVLASNAILSLERSAARTGFLRGLHDGMIFDRNVANPVFGCREPFVRRVAEHRFDLRADVEPLALSAEFRDIADGRDLFDEHAVLDFGFGASPLRANPFRDVPAHADGAAIRQGGYGHFRGDCGSIATAHGDGSVPPAMLL